MAEDKRTLIEEGTELSGTLRSSCPVVVKGRVEGELSTPSLTVAASGVVQGKGKVGALVSEGELMGEFDAESVRLSGSVKSGTVLRARTLEVKLEAEGAQRVSFGDVDLEVGDPPRDG